MRMLLLVMAFVALLAALSALLGMMPMPVLPLLLGGAIYCAWLAITGDVRRIN